tara:strand:- start:49 stop:498 length:450 start_codon:yes stop_codon:yes gene_type:complete
VLFSNFGLKVRIVTDSTSTKIQFLKDCGADLCRHSGGTLLEHLVGTRDILKKQGAPEYLQDAGLFHSVYGTAYYMPEEGISTSREEIQKLIGIQAEEIAYWYCVLQAPRITEIVKFEGQLKEDLLWLDLANNEEMQRGRMMTWDEAYDL